MTARICFLVCALAACTVPNMPGDPGPKMIQDGGGGGNSDGGGNPSGSQCPCAKGNYCDLATQTCKPGCAQESDCSPTETCDLSTRTCKPLPKNDMGMPIGGACGQVASFMNASSGPCFGCFITQCTQALQPCESEAQTCAQQCQPDAGPLSILSGCECVRSCLSAMCRPAWDAAVSCAATTCIAECK
jgi:hypothetical protein